MILTNFTEIYWYRFDPERFLHESKEQGAFLNLLLGKDADSQSHLKTLLYAAITNFTTTFSQLNLSIRNHDGVLVIEAS